jgi:hypothetical protein
MPELTSMPRDEQATVDNHGFRLALGASPSCQSLGLGSCSSGGGGQDAATNESSSETTTVSDTMNLTALSHNITVRKSLVNSSKKKRANASVNDDDFSVSDLADLSGMAEEDVAQPKLTTHEVEAQFPGIVKTKPKDRFSSPVSPMMSPDSLRLSDEFEPAIDTHYAAPIVTDADIAGLSPIMWSRESDIRSTRMSPLVELRPPAVEARVTHAEETTKSASSCIDSSQRSEEDNKESHQYLLSLIYDAFATQESDHDDEDFEDIVVAKHQSDVTEASGALPMEDHVKMSKTASVEDQGPQEDSIEFSHDSEIRESNQDASNKHRHSSQSSPIIVNDNEASLVSEKEAASFKKDPFKAVSTHIRISQIYKESQKMDDSSSVNASGDNEINLNDNDDNTADDSQPEEQEHETFVSTASNAKVANSTNVDSNVSEDVNEDEVRARLLYAANEERQDSTRSPASITYEVGNLISRTKNGTKLHQETTDGSFGGLGTVNTQEGDSTGEDHVEVALRKEPTGTYRDLTSAKKNLDASSMAFIDRLRGAAHRRKLRVARSRDSLAAKEKEHLLSVASANRRRQLMAPKEAPANTNIFSTQSTVTMEPYKPFKARPVPSTTGQFGSGGQVGVPKVEKKPATTPFSPLLGARRTHKEKLPSIKSPTRNVHRRSASQLVSIVAESLTPKKSKSRGHMQSTSTHFKARPAPPTTGFMGQGGQVGVPKVIKRPVTVPVSPSLGISRSSMPAASKPNPSLVQRCHHFNAKNNAKSTKALPWKLTGSEVSFTVWSFDL